MSMMLLSAVPPVYFIIFTTHGDINMDYNFDVIDQHFSDMVTTDMSFLFYTHKEEFV
jgi:hypothetical protein